MTADREQVRRDAEKFPDRETATNWLIHRLEQAERERDEALRLARVNAQGFDEHETRADELEARLAKVPALVEALRKIADVDCVTKSLGATDASIDGEPSRLTYVRVLKPYEVAREALAAWEQE